MQLIEALDLKFPAVISLVGGGGKTSFIFTLAREAAAQGRSVLITTTTAMFNPDYETRDLGPNGRVMIGPAGPMVDQLTIRSSLAGAITLAARSTRKGGKKLTGYPPEELAPILSPQRFDLVLIEADGARMRPVKAPADHEPVIPEQTRMVVGCMGLDCLGTPLADPYVHRPEQLAELAGQAVGSPITPATLACLAASSSGLFKSAGPDIKKVFVLNKADTPNQLEQGKAAGRQIISSSPADLGLVTSFLKSDTPVRRCISRQLI